MYNTIKLDLDKITWEIISLDLSYHNDVEYKSLFIMWFHNFVVEIIGRSDRLVGVIHSDVCVPCTDSLPSLVFSRV